MKAVVQRVTSARVTVDGTVSGEIGEGLVVLLGVADGDDMATARRLAEKTVSLRIFEDAGGKMNRSVVDTGGSLLCVSQFTLLGDTRRGNRPSFTGAAAPEVAIDIYEEFCSAIEHRGVTCERGVFGAHMDVELTNSGPVTIILDSADFERSRR
jgi:D-tyrosyl-tRNA(Tyr) deacylase